MVKKIYFGAPLFSKAEQLFNAHLVEKIRNLYGEKVEVYLPQENDEINDKTKVAESLDIFYGDIAHLEKSDLMIAVLDGQVIDPGLAAEIGYCYAKGIPVLGLITDVRVGTNKGKEFALGLIGENQNMYFNLFVIGAIKACGDLFYDYERLINKGIKHTLGLYEDKAEESVAAPKDVSFFVDGSYRTTVSTEKAGWSWVSPELNSYKNGVVDAQGSNQVGGEIHAVKEVLKECIKRDIKNPTIYYDYQGIMMWATGGWKTNKEITKSYANFVSDVMMKHKIKPTFIHVKGHSGVDGNEEADRLAKKALDEYRLRN